MGKWCDLLTILFLYILNIHFTIVLSPHVFWNLLLCNFNIFPVLLIYTLCCVRVLLFLIFCMSIIRRIDMTFSDIFFSYILCQNTLSNILHHCSEELYFWEIRSPTFLPFCHYSSIYSRFNPPCFMKTVQRYIIEEGSLSSVLEHGNHIRSASW